MVGILVKSGEKMAETKIEPHKITKPIQLTATWLAGLVLLVSVFVAGAGTIKNPPWLAPTFGITAIVMVPSYSTLVFLMQTKFRPQLQEDPFNAIWLQR